MVRKLKESVYSVTYCYDDEWSGSGCSEEEFKGSWLELQDYISRLKADGYYNINASFLYDEDDVYDEAIQKQGKNLKEERPLYESGNPHISEESFSVPFKYVASKNGGCDFIYNASTEKGFLYFDAYCVLIRVSKSKVDKFIDVYYNEEIPDPGEEYGIDEPDESDYYRVYKDKGIIDDFLILDENQYAPDVIGELLFDGSTSVQGYN